MNIVIISGSSREQSRSLRVALALQQWLQKETRHTIHLIDCRTLTPRRFQQVIISEEAAPDAMKTLARTYFEADAFIWVNPEYNGTYTAAFKDLIDHFPKIPRKAVGIVSVSNGGFGGMRSTQHIYPLAGAVFGIASPQFLVVPRVEEKFDATGALTDESFYKNIHLFITEFLWLAESLASGKK